MEIVHLQPCKPPKGSGDEQLWAINIDCGTAAAFPFAQLRDDPNPEDGPCGADITYLDRPLQCRPFAGFVCHFDDYYIGIGTYVNGRCLEARDPVLALKLTYHFTS